MKIFSRALLLGCLTLIFLKEVTATNKAATGRTSDSKSEADPKEKKYITVPDCPADIKSDNSKCYKYSVDNAKVDVKLLVTQASSEITAFVEKQSGMTISGMIGLAFFLLSLPNLIIVGGIFLICWYWGFCCFSKNYRGPPYTRLRHLGQVNDAGAFVPSKSATDPSATDPSAADPTAISGNSLSDAK